MKSSSITKRTSKKGGTSITFKGPIANAFFQMLKEKLDPPQPDPSQPDPAASAAKPGVRT